MIKIFKHKKILLILIPIILIALFVFFGNKHTKIDTIGISINSIKKQYVETEKDVTKLNLKYSTNTNHTVELKIYDPNGELKDSGIIASNSIYEKEFNNIEGEWIIEFTTSTKEDILVESTITKK